MPKVMFGKYRPDVASIDTQGTSFVQNVLPVPYGYGPVRDLLKFADPLPGRCLGAIGVLDQDNTSHVFAGTETKLYKLNGTTRAWDDVTRLSGNYTVGDRRYWDFDIFGQNVVAVTDANDPQAFTLGTSTEFNDLPDAPQANRVSVVGDFLVLSGLTANPNRIHWSGLNDITHWTPGTASCDYQDFPDGGQTVDVASGEFGLVFQDTAIRRMVFNPVSDAIFDFSRISEERGLFMPYSLVRVHSVAFFYSSDGFYKIDASGAITPIGENAVDATIGENADLTNPRNMIGLADPKSQRIWWFYKSVGNNNAGYLDQSVVFDWIRGEWSPVTINVEFVTATSPLSATLESLDALGTVDSIDISFDLFQATPEHKMTGFATDHAPGYFEGDTLEAILDLPEAAIGNQVRMGARSASPLSDSPTVYIKVGHREALNAAIAWSAESGISARGYAPLRTSGRFLTGRVRIPAGTNWTWIRGMDVDAISMGTR